MITIRARRRQACFRIQIIATIRRNSTIYKLCQGRTIVINVIVVSELNQLVVLGKYGHGAIATRPKQDGEAHYSNAA